MEKIILASGSPRRKEIFEKNNVIFETIVSDVDESYSSTYSKEQIVMIIALRKALDIEMKYKEGIVIAADTIVCIDEILGKPTDREHAYYMLKKLSGRSHEVITGVAVIRINSFERVVFYDSTKVFFKELTDDEIYSYISSGEGWDKAGAYAVQGMGSELIDKLDGDYYNVMGLPFDKLKLVLKGRFNVEL